MYIQVEEEKECIAFHKKKENEISLFFLCTLVVSKNSRWKKKNEKENVLIVDNCFTSSERLLTIETKVHFEAFSIHSYQWKTVYRYQAQNKISIKIV
jgi:hypothetical protein